MAVQQFVQYLFSVDSIKHCLAHSHIRNVSGLDEHGLIGYGRAVNYFHVVKRFHAGVILGRNHAHGMLCNIDFTGLQARIQLASVHDFNVQLVKLGRASPVIGIGFI